MTEFYTEEQKQSESDLTKNYYEQQKIETETETAKEEEVKKQFYTEEQKQSVYSPVTQTYSSTPSVTTSEGKKIAEEQYQKITTTNQEQNTNISKNTTKEKTNIVQTTINKLKEKYTELVNNKKEEPTVGGALARIITQEPATRKVTQTVPGFFGDIGSYSIELNEGESAWNKKGELISDKVGMIQVTDELTIKDITQTFKEVWKKNKKSVKTKLALAGMINSATGGNIFVPFLAPEGNEKKTINGKKVAQIGMTGAIALGTEVTTTIGTTAIALAPYVVVGLVGLTATKLSYDMRYSKKTMNVNLPVDKSGDGYWKKLREEINNKKEELIPTIINKNILDNDLIHINKNKNQNRNVNRNINDSVFPNEHENVNVNINSNLNKNLFERGFSYGNVKENEYNYAYAHMNVNLNARVNALPNFNLNLNLRNKNNKTRIIKNKIIKQKRSYSPSLASGFFGITSTKKPTKNKVYSGLEVRPVIIKKTKKKKSKNIFSNNNYSKLNFKKDPFKKKKKSKNIFGGNFKI